ncbi:class I SAM-dependent methyltransferase [Thermoleophilia bacterium SCSIO 60948]|nr:class I SAM-dependent methyltransferase [Thermoleophilia bacterium SCSIO 60948]
MIAIGTDPTGAAAWQDVECGGYSADLPRLVELALSARGPVVELGAGSGRVALELAGAGADVIAVESDPSLAAELTARAAERGLAGQLSVLATGAAEADVDPGSVARVLAPMQFLHLLPADARAELLEQVHGWIAPGGLLAAVVLADTAAAIAGDPDDAPPLPDVRERDGWVLSSLPVGLRVEPGRIEVDRVRQAVSPDGELTESHSVDILWDLDADGLVSEALRAGFTELGRERLPSDELHVDSILVLLEAR